MKALQWIVTLRIKHDARSLVSAFLVNTCWLFFFVSSRFVIYTVSFFPFETCVGVCPSSASKASKASKYGTSEVDKSDSVLNKVALFLVLGIKVKFQHLS